MGKCHFLSKPATRPQRVQEKPVVEKRKLTIHNFENLLKAISEADSIPCHTSWHAVPTTRSPIVPGNGILL